MNATVERLAQALAAARREHRATAPPTEPLSEADAYAVQDRVAELLGFGPRSAARHWKAGPVLANLPQVHAPLPPAGVKASPARLPASGFHHMAIVWAEPGDEVVAEFPAIGRAALPL